MTWVLGIALLVGFILGQVWEARQGINRVTRSRLDEDAEADAVYRRRVLHEADQYNETSSRPE